MRGAARILAAGLLPVVFGALFAACESPNEPPMPGGRVVLRFEPAATVAALPATDPAMTAAALFDSVAVRVYRGGGSALRPETAKGVAIVSDDPIDVSLACVAEPGKKVSVELFVDGWLVYHGADGDVDVAAGKSTAVTIDVAPFFIETLAVTPAVVAAGSVFTLNWSTAPAAGFYRVEASATPDFASIEWTQTVPDTTVEVQLDPGSHYFRVSPETRYATGPETLPQFGYVVGGSQDVLVTGFSSPAVIPGETVTILGENLDFPGTEAWVGSQQMTIESASWGALVARAPATATTNWVGVTNAIGTDLSPDALILQRIAYVTAAGGYAGAYTDVLGRYAKDLGYSGVAVIPVSQLDTRDMGAFDVIIVASDTGSDPQTWGGNPARAAAITGAGTGVLAIGEGGAAFVRVAIAGGSGVQVQETFQTSYYTDTPGADVFTTPYAVTSGVLPQWVDFCKDEERTLSLVSAAKPANMNVYAKTGILADAWVMADFDDPSAGRILFWGFAADPSGLTSRGEDGLANMLSSLYLAFGPVQ